jgi:hypothetical protein
MAETQTATHPPQLTSINRVGKIPVVSDTLVSLNSILSQNAYSKGLYSTAQAYSERAYNLSTPVQVCPFCPFRQDALTVTCTGSSGPCYRPCGWIRQ